MPVLLPSEPVKNEIKYARRSSFFVVAQSSSSVIDGKTAGAEVSRFSVKIIVILTLCIQYKKNPRMD